MSGADTLIWTDIDYDRDGKQVATLNMEYSVTRSGYGVVPIPIAVIKNGAGPSVLLIAGNHGDEYEGQVILTRLIRSLQPAQIKGRLIILPAANLPAAIEGVRVSPLDGGNLNRSFPGTPLGSPTERIAHYIAEVLMPQCQAFYDLHSGGTSLNYLPYVHADVPAGDDAASADLAARTAAAMDFINAPIAVTLQAGSRPSGIAAEAALRHGLLAISGEFGGAGTISPAGVAVAERGLYRLLAHLGILGLDARWADRGASRKMTLDRSMYLFAPTDGVFEPVHQLGAEVSKGDLAGCVYFPEDPVRAPVEVPFGATGLVVCQRAIARVKRGDCLGHLFGAL
jgi:predicted deacylase